MKKLTEFIVNKRLFFAILFTLLAIAGIVGSTFVNVNYDMSKYLPSDSETTIGFEILKDEFGDNAQLLVMAKNISLADALSLKDEIAKVDSVLSVVVDENFYKEESALYQVILTQSAYDAKSIEAIDEIKLLGSFHYSGQGATAYESLKTMESEITKSVIILLPLLILILFIATTSYLEPLVFIVVIGVSILINMGSNVIFPEISYLTQGVAAILQLALSMDYAIFLLHSYQREKAGGLESGAAMKAALRKSFSAILASSLTTIAGFAALMFMRFSIGLDMGLVLGKGILCSLICVFLLMPGLVVFLDKAIEKTRHKNFFAWVGGAFRSKKKTVDAVVKSSASAKYTKGLKMTRFILPILLIAIIVPSYFFQSNNTFLYGDFSSVGGVGSTLYADREEINDIYGNINSSIILVPLTNQDKELGLSMELLEHKKIDSVMSYSLIVAQLQAQYGPYFNEEMIPIEVKKQFLGSKHSRIVINLMVEEESQEAFELTNEIKSIVSKYVDTGVYVLGATSSALEIKETTSTDYNLVNILTILFIATILLIVLRSALLPIILLTVIQSAFFLNMAIPYLLGQPIIFIGYIIVSCIQMGATIDYAILFTTKYTESRKTLSKYDAIANAMKLSFGAILTSSSILCVAGFTLGLAATLPATQLIGLSLGRGALTSMLLVFVLLPQLFMLLDTPIKYTTLKGRKDFIK